MAFLTQLSKKIQEWEEVTSNKARSVDAHQQAAEAQAKAEAEVRATAATVVAQEAVPEAFPTLEEVKATAAAQEAAPTTAVATDAEEEGKKKAALKIQALYRGRLGRKAAKKARDEANGALPIHIEAREGAANIGADNNQHVFKEISNINEKDEQGKTPLHYAVEAKNLATIAGLIFKEG